MRSTDEIAPDTCAAPTVAIEGHRSLAGRALHPRRPPQRDLCIGLCVPLGGTTGIWGPSALASARLAVAELNQGAGIVGQRCRLLTINGADESPHIESTLRELVAHQELDALVGMHTSAVRQRVVPALGERIPYVYTPQYEGGERTPGVFAIGETAASELQPAIAWLTNNKRPRRWMFVGNDYVCPHVSHSLARHYVAGCGGSVVAERYVALGTSDYSQVLSEIRSAQVDAVLLSLVGQDAIDFNRAFGREGLAGRVTRLTRAAAENELLAIGAENTENLYVACGYFAALETDDNLAFKERYDNHFGERAPTLNTFGQSTYEGIHFLAELIRHTTRTRTDFRALGADSIRYRSARGGTFAAGGSAKESIYLARADGHSFRIITKL